MANIQFTSMPTKDAEHYWNGGLDAYGQKPQSGISDGSGLPSGTANKISKKGKSFSYLPINLLKKINPSQKQARYSCINMLALAILKQAQRPKCF
nr:hypothetical protein [Curvivirga aplysinae]